MQCSHKLSYTTGEYGKLDYVALEVHRLGHDVLVDWTSGIYCMPIGFLLKWSGFVHFSLFSCPYIVAGLVNPS